MKGGEDLRSDERIMLLFSLMNSLVTSSSTAAGGGGGGGGSAGSHTQIDSCPLPGGDQSSSSTSASGGSGSSNTGLMARTYTVIPMTSKVGLLEWVPNTTPLRTILQDEMSACPVFLANTKNIRDKRGQIDLRQIAAWKEITKLHGCFEKPEAKSYHEMYNKVTKDSADKAFRAAQSVLPDDFLRRHLLKLSSGFEDLLRSRLTLFYTNPGLSYNLTYPILSHLCLLR